MTSEKLVFHALLGTSELALRKSFISGAVRRFLSGRFSGEYRTNQRNRIWLVAARCAFLFPANRNESKRSANAFDAKRCVHKSDKLYAMLLIHFVFFRIVFRVWLVSGRTSNANRKREYSIAARASRERHSHNKSPDSRSPKGAEITRNLHRRTEWDTANRKECAILQATTRKPLQRMQRRPKRLMIYSCRC